MATHIFEHATNRRILPLIEEMGGASERAAAVLSCCILDTLLDAAIQSFLVNIHANGIEKFLFGTRGPLSATGTKISLARAMNLIGVHTYADALQIVGVRNLAGHMREPFSFETNRCSEHIGQLRIPYNLAIPLHDKWPNGRRRFSTSVHGVSLAISISNWMRETGRYADRPYDFTREFGFTENEPSPSRGK